MQIPTNNKSNEKVAENSQEKRDASSPDRAVSPTPSLRPCEHCGEEYCTDAVVATAQLARRCKLSAIAISHSTPSTPAKPLRKKRKLDSLVMKAKEQAVPDFCPTHLPADMATGRSPARHVPSSPERKERTEHTRSERTTRLQLATPGTEYISRDFAPQGDPFVYSPPPPGSPDKRSPERRKLDELRQGVQIVYKRQPAPKPSRLSFLKR
ncbi:uncharacterized protein LTHEOB_2892 [Neofusicoccum parvum]|nr:uncharacterized protein LTHEOB_2892 [Neofusicoccum parvum]